MQLFWIRASTRLDLTLACYSYIHVDKAHGLQASENSVRVEGCHRRDNAAAATITAARDAASKAQGCFCEPRCSKVVTRIPGTREENLNLGHSDAAVFGGCLGGC